MPFIDNMINQEHNSFIKRSFLTGLLTYKLALTATGSCSVRFCMIVNLMTIVILVGWPVAISRASPISPARHKSWSGAEECRQRGALWAPSAATGSCVHLLEPNHECGSDSELMLLRSSGDEEVAQCGTLSLTSPSSCPAGQSSTVHLTGQVTCDCLAGHVFWPTDGTCYLLYSRGPCAENEILTMDTGGSSAVCSINLCGTGKVLWNNSCVSVGHRGCGSDGRDYLHVNPVTMDLQCGEQCPNGQVSVVGGCHTLYHRGPCRINQVVMATAIHGQGECRTLTSKCPSATPVEWNARCWTRGQVCRQRYPETMMLQPRRSGFSSRKSSASPSPLTAWSLLPFVFNFSKPPLLHQYHAYDGKLVKDSSLITNLNPSWVGKTNSLHYQRKVMFGDTSKVHSVIRHSIKTEFVKSNKSVSGSTSDMITKPRAELPEEPTITTNQNHTIFRWQRSTTNSRHQDHWRSNKDFQVPLESGPLDEGQHQKPWNSGHRDQHQGEWDSKQGDQHQEPRGGTHGEQHQGPWNGKHEDQHPKPWGSEDLYRYQEPWDSKHEDHHQEPWNNDKDRRDNGRKPTWSTNIGFGNQIANHRTRFSKVSSSGPLKSTTSQYQPSSDNYNLDVEFNSDISLAVITVDESGTVYCVPQNPSEMYRCSKGSRRHMQGKCSPHHK